MLACRSSFLTYITMLQAKRATCSVYNTRQSSLLQSVLQVNMIARGNHTTQCITKSSAWVWVTPTQHVNTQFSYDLEMG